MIYEEFHKVYPTCSLSMEGNYLKNATKRNTAGPFWVAHAHCRTGNCIAVTFTIDECPNPGDKVTVKTKVVGNCTHYKEDVHITLPNQRPLSGMKRQSQVEEMQRSGISASAHHYQKLGNLTACEVNSGNTSECQSPPVFRQALYESRRKERLHEDVIQELEIQRMALETSMPGKHVNGFIQTVTLYPFHFSLFCQRQIDAYVNIVMDDKESTLHIDATGSVVKLPKKTGHDTVYVYSAVLANDSLPVFEFVATWHRAFALQT